MDASSGDGLDPRVDPAKKERVQEAKTVSMLLHKMDKIVTDGSIWHLVSLKWIEAWQKYTYFDFLDGQTPLPLEEKERSHPGEIDSKDIILKPPEGTILLDMAKNSQWQNTLLKPNLKEGEDFMIVDEDVWSYVSLRYSSKNDIVRKGIMVNEETDEAIVEIYLKSVLILPMPNSPNHFGFNAPKTVILSRRETINELMKKIQRVLNYYLYNVKKIKDVMINDIRLWKSLTNNLNEIERLDKKYKTST